QRHPPERGEWTGAQVARRLLEQVVEAPEPADDDEEEVRHDVNEVAYRHRPEREWHLRLHEEREEGDPEEETRERGREEHEEADETAAAEVVTGDADPRKRPHDDHHEDGDQRDAKARHDRVTVERGREDRAVPAQRPAVERERQPGGLVEREEHDDCDRCEQEHEHERPVDEQAGDVQPLHQIPRSFSSRVSTSYTRKKIVSITNEIAAPAGRFPSARNSSETMFASDVELVPPSSAGVM